VRAGSTLSLRHQLGAGAFKLSCCQTPKFSMCAFVELGPAGDIMILQFPAKDHDGTIGVVSAHEPTSPRALTPLAASRSTSWQPECTLSATLGCLPASRCTRAIGALTAVTATDWHGRRHWQARSESLTEPKQDSESGHSESGLPLARALPPDGQ
jgi:hypothetical protein